MKSASVLILAGGRSERMGSPKPLLLMEGKTFVEKIADGYFEFGIKHTVLVLNERFIRFLPAGIRNVKVVSNHHPEKGRLHSLKIGLRKLSDSDFVFIHNVDNPFVEQDVLCNMWANRSDQSFVVPAHFSRSGHPVLIPKIVISSILSAADSTYTLRAILSRFDRIEVETGSDRIFTNINTWNDYEEHVLNLIPEYSHD